MVRRAWRGLVSWAMTTSERWGRGRLVFDKYRSRYDGDLTSWRATSLPIALDVDPGGV